MGSLLIKYDISDFIQKWESYMDDLLNQIEQQRKKNKNVQELIEIYKKMNFIDSKMPVSYTHLTLPTKRIV